MSQEPAILVGSRTIILDDGSVRYQNIARFIPSYYDCMTIVIKVKINDYKSDYKIKNDDIWCYKQKRL